jgi:hypothetical protein
MVKYKEVISDMLEYNKEEFLTFKKLHDLYVDDPKQYQAAFNEEGEKILRIIRRYENILCGKSESGKYGKFSTTLSDKFWNEVRIHFPKIDAIGTL